MPRYKVKSEKGYGNIEADWEAIRKGNKKARAEADARKTPTSVALDPRFVAELKDFAKKKGIPYQILMRIFIIEGFNRMKKSG